MLPNQAKNISEIQLVENGRLISVSISISISISRTDVANALNDYFINAVSSHWHNLPPEAYEMHPSVTSIMQKFDGQMKFSFSPVKEDNVKKIFDILKLNKATGADVISARMLKLAQPLILCSVTT